MRCVGPFLLLSMSAFAQTNIVQFTNRVATFTNLQGRAYDRVELIRMDAHSILYRDSAGGGRVYLTNLSAATLASLGLNTNLAAEATRLDREVAQQKAASEAEERARMSDPKNWRDVRVLTVHRWWEDRLECQIAEISKRVLLRRPPVALVAYFSKRSDLAGSLHAVELERQKVMTQVTQLDSRIKAFDAQIKQRQYQIDIADANTPTSVEGNATLVNDVMARRFEINTAQINLNLDKNRLEAMRAELEPLLKQIPEITTRAADINTEIQRLDRESSKALTVRVFITSRRYYDFPILECSPN